MKILINALSARLGGGQTYLLNILGRAPNRLDLEFYLLAPKSLVIPDTKYTIHRIETPDYLVSNLFLRAIWEKCTLPKMLKKMGINILFCPGGSLNGTIPQKCKTVVTFQNMLPFDDAQVKKYGWSFSRIRNMLLKRKLLKSMEKADLVIFISEYAKNFIANFTKHPIKNSICIHHGTDPDFFNHSNNSCHLPEWLPNEGYLLYVSPLDVYKAHLEVIQAYANLKDRMKSVPKLFFIGTQLNKTYSKKVKKLIQKEGLEQEIQIIGHVDHHLLPAIYQNAMINIFASETENCPFVLLEALAAGRPLIVSSRPPMPEIAGNAALYFDPREPEQLTDRLECLLTNPELRNTMSNLSLEKSAHYSWDRSAKMTWESIIALCANYSGH